MTWAGFFKQWEEGNMALGGPESYFTGTADWNGASGENVLLGMRRAAALEQNAAGCPTPRRVWKSGVSGCPGLYQHASRERPVSKLELYVPRPYSHCIPKGLLPLRTVLHLRSVIGSLKSLLGFRKAGRFQGALFSIRRQALPSREDPKYCEKDLLLRNFLTRTENGRKMILKRDT